MEFVLAEDPYLVLGVKKGAPLAEVRKAYRKLAKEFHPDKNPGNKAAEEKFKKISAAFSFLDDEGRKAKFDNGEIDADGNPAFAGFGGGGFKGGSNPFGGGDPFGPGGPFAGMNAGGGPRRGQGGFGSPDFEDFFGDLFGAGLRGNMKQGSTRPNQKGQDINSNLDIETLDAILGAKKRISVNGAQVEIAIPSGVEEGQTLRLRGKGGKGVPNGDLLVKVHILPDKNYLIQGMDVYSDLHISLKEAILGAKVEIPTPLGNVAMTLKPNSNSGQLLRLKGRGIAKGDKIGDFYVKLLISLPDGDNSELGNLLNSWSGFEKIPSKRG